MKLVLPEPTPSPPPPQAAWSSAASTTATSSGILNKLDLAIWKFLEDWLTSGSSLAIRLVIEVHADAHALVRALLAEIVLAQRCGPANDLGEGSLPGLAHQGPHAFYRLRPQVVSVDALLQHGRRRTEHVVHGGGEMVGHVVGQQLQHLRRFFGRDEGVDSEPDLVLGILAGARNQFGDPQAQQLSQHRVGANVVRYRCGQGFERSGAA